MEQLIIKGKKATITIEYEGNMNDDLDLALLGLEMCKAYLMPKEYITNLANYVESINKDLKFNTKGGLD